MRYEWTLRIILGITFYDGTDKGFTGNFYCEKQLKSKKFLLVKYKNVKIVDKLMTLPINSSRPAARKLHALFTLHRKHIFVSIYDRFARIFAEFSPIKSYCRLHHYFLGEKRIFGKRTWMFDENCGWVNDVKKVKHTILKFIYGHLNQKCI